MPTNSSTTVSPNPNSKGKLAIYQKYMELIYYTNDLIRKYPKSETFALVKEIKLSLYFGLKSLMSSFEESNKTEKSNLFDDFYDNLKILKSLYNILYQSEYITLSNLNDVESLISILLINI